MPVSKRPDTGAWEVVVGHGGKTYRRSSRRWSRAQACEVEAKLRKDLFAFDVGRKPDRTFNDAVERWQREELPRLKERSRIEAIRNARHIAPFIEGRNLRDGADIGGEIRGAWPGLSPATINRRLAVLSRLCRLARDWGWIDSAPSIRTLREPVAGRFLTMEQVEAIASGTPRIGPLVLLAAYTGIRIGHLLRLKRSDVEGRFLKLDSSGKTGKLQLVPLHPRVQGYAEGLPVKGISYAVFYAEFRAACRALGIKAKPHDLRHTNASWLIQSGADLLHVRDMLGHSSVAVTQRYAHLRAEHLAEAVNRIGSPRTPRRGKKKPAKKAGISL